MRFLRAFVLTLTATLLLATPAVAGQGNVGQDPTQTGDGYAVSVTMTGDAAPKGGGGSIVIKVAAKCWWRTASGPYDNPQLMLDEYDRVHASTAPDYVKGAYGDRQAFVDALDKPVGTVQWWTAYCKDPADYIGYTKQTFRIFNGTTLAVTYRLFNVVNGTVNPPPPLVAPEDLARAAQDVMVLPLPQVGRNPMTSAAGLAGATFVNLPTWFWVTDPAAVGGATGTRTIRAEIVGTPVWAQVVARTQGLQISSPAGTTTCPPSSALVQWSPGATEAAACTLAFTRASVAYPGGYPVTTTTSWTATWTGSGGTGGTLPTLAREVTTAVPVAESQAVVTSGA